MPVRVPGEWTFCLFAFHWERQRFIRPQLNALQARAVQVASLLLAERAERQLEVETPFALLGKAYGSMAHDLGTLLSTLSVDRFVGTLAAGGTLDGQSLAEMENVQGAIRTAANIIATFRGIGRGERDDVVVLQLRDEVAKVVSELRYVCQALHGNIHVAPGFPDALTVRWRCGSLRQVLANLVLNADQQIKLMPWRDHVKGVVEAELATETTAGECWACLRVHDTGPGIHAGDFERVFDVGHSTKPDGFGMGLDICRRLAREVQHGKRQGEVKVRRSLLFCGTTLEVRLPVG